MIEAALKSLLVTNAGVSSRVYPVRLPQNAIFPAVTYQRVGGNRISSLSGPSGLAHPRFQTDVWAETYAESKTIAASIRTALDGYSGTVDTLRIGGSILVSEWERYEPDAALYRVSMDFNIFHDE